MTHDDIIGTAFEFLYSDETYCIEVLTNDSLRWTRTRGADEGKTDTEAYVFSTLSADTFMLTWIEADGLGLSNVLTPSARRLITHANMGREVFVNQGELRVMG